MKYLVIYSMDGFNAAKAFSSRSNAVDYINECTDKIDENISELKTLDDEHYRMTLKNGKIFQIRIESVDESKIRYDLVYDKNGRHVETRRFTKRQLAVDRAHAILDKLEFAPDKDEDKIGEWSAEDSSSNLRVVLALRLVILDGAKTASSDYAKLGIKSGAFEEEIKSAYRTMSKKYHPDTGGDPKKFAEIHEAYERIRAGKAEGSAKPSISEAYSSVDMRAFFDGFNKKVATNAKADKAAAYAMIRSAALKLMGRGILSLIFGGIIIAIFSSNSGAMGFFGIIAYILIIYGLNLLVRGFGYFLSPGSALKHLK